jgi:hypothetical protein
MIASLYLCLLSFVVAALVSAAVARYFVVYSIHSNALWNLRSDMYTWLPRFGAMVWHPRYWHMWTYSSWWHWTDRQRAQAMTGAGDRQP